jgi:hypothetical protein
VAKLVFRGKERGQKRAELLWLKNNNNNNNNNNRKIKPTK